MMGSPLAVYLDKHIDDRPALVDLVKVPLFPSFSLSLTAQKHGGTVSPGYSGVPYILGNAINYP